MIDFKRVSTNFEKEIKNIGKNKKIVIFSHVDADGVSAGVLVYKTLKENGFNVTDLLYPEKGENGFSDSAISRVLEKKPDVVFIVDLGSYKRNFEGVEKVIIIDHHKPEGVVENGVLFTSFPPPPYISAAYLSFLLFNNIDFSPKDFLGAIGEAGDFGTGVKDVPLYDEILKKYKKKWVSYVASLVNAARRIPEFNIKTSTKYLMNANKFSDLLIETEEKNLLETYRKRVKEEVDKWKRIRPKFSQSLALIEINSKYLIHPIIAQIWRNVLKNYIVVCANHGYIDGRVAFSMRTSLSTSVLSFLRKYTEPSLDEDLGFGHERATGGIVTVDKWKDMLSLWGFKDS
ncbi:MAG: hypothetical protein DRI28_01460 [Caldiserica bacterium]|nr:MAG: hypothetical protein DRI28_01460 [Caldisericota bacterium]